jgi:CheY-like chemotaxis protein
MAFVLVVDDDEFTCTMLERLFARMGYTASCVGRGQDALEVLGTLRPDLVVLDWMMPDMDGLEVLRRLRADPRNHDLPVVMYSAADDNGMTEKAAKLGAQDTVLKSGGFFDLYKRIERYVH